MTASHSSSLSCEIVGFFKRRQHREHCRQICFLDVQHQADFAQRVDRAFEQHANVFEFAPFSTRRPRHLVFAINWVFDSRTVSMIRSLFARSEEPVSVTSTMASASSGGFTSVAPQLNSTFAVTPFAARYRFVARHEFGRDDLAFEVLHGRKGDASGTASTQRTLPKLCFA